MTASIWWIRRDLRLQDNMALRAALAAGDEMIPVFVLDPALLNGKAPRREAFLLEGLRRLDESLRARGSRLILRSGAPETALPALLAETCAERIFAGSDITPFARKRDAALQRLDLPLTFTDDVTVYPAHQVLKGDQTPYGVFTPYSRAWLSQDFPSERLWTPPQRFSSAGLDLVVSEPIPAADAALWAGFPPGEEEALRRLEEFCAGDLYRYADLRDRLDLDNVSALSPYLHLGMLSAVRAVAAARQAEILAPDESARQGCQKWMNELIWREFYQMVLFQHPRVAKRAFQEKLSDIRWRDPLTEAAADWQAWQSGATGYPVVDACMRQLAQTGWMHNRGRMIVASFLVKDLLIDWRMGEAWFMRQLLDGDLAANNGGWQWTAGVGTDAAPYFRVFNPTLQGQRFDPQGNFVRRWVPEIAHLPDRLIHCPWRAGSAAAYYPPPVVDHAAARQRALAAFKAAEQSFGK